MSPLLVPSVLSTRPLRPAGYHLNGTREKPVLDVLDTSTKCRYLNQEASKTGNKNTTKNNDQT